MKTEIKTEVLTFSAVQRNDRYTWEYTTVCNGSYTLNVMSKSIINFIANGTRPSDKIVIKMFDSKYWRRLVAIEMREAADLAAEHNMTTIWNTDETTKVIEVNTDSISDYWQSQYERFCRTMICK